MNIGQKYDIFISYRRATGANAARMMQLALTARGYSVFFDYSSLKDGKFNEAIYSAIDSCEVFILMMTEGALDRCAEEGDWVRLEIQRAIEKGKHIVPIRPSDQVWEDFPNNLPKELAAICKEQVSKLDMETLFESSLDEIENYRFSKELRARRRLPGALKAGDDYLSSVTHAGEVFVGRDQEMGVLAKMLSEQKVPVITGAGGMGKSELVRQYAVRCRDAYPGGRFQVDMETARTWNDVFEKLLSGKLGNGQFVRDLLDDRRDEEKNMPLDVGQALLRRARRSGAVLLFLDNVESVGAFVGRDGRLTAFTTDFADGVRLDIVMTTRVSDATLRPTGRVIELPLGDLSPAAAQELLLKDWPTAGDAERKAAGRVAELLGYRALHLQCVPALIGDVTASVICDSFAELERELRADFLKTVSAGTEKDYWPEVLWNKTSERLLPLKPLGPACVKLAQAASYFSPDGFPQHILRHLWRTFAPPEYEAKFDRALSILQRHGIFQSVEPVCIHRLHREAILQAAKGVEGLEQILGSTLAEYGLLSKKDWISLYEHEGIRSYFPNSLLMDGRFWAELLRANPQYEDHCPWEMLNGEAWKLLLCKQPQFANRCPWEKLDGGAWCVILAEQPQFADYCAWEKLGLTHWLLLITYQPVFIDRCRSTGRDVDPFVWVAILCQQPNLAEDCPWEKLSGAEWAALLGSKPQFADRCPWERLAGGSWATLLCEQPQFADRCPWERLDAEAWRDLLCAQPQFAEHCPWHKFNSEDWRQILATQPQFADRCPWEILDGKAWSKLLLVRPQFADFCPWEKMDGGDWATLLGGIGGIDLSVAPANMRLDEIEGAYLQAQAQFADRCSWEKLSGKNWRELLVVQPQFADRCLWEKLDGEDWHELLRTQPQFAEHCLWESFEGELWCKILSEQPQFAPHCAWGKLDGNEWSYLLSHQPMFANCCSWEKLEGGSWAYLLSAQPQFAGRCPWERLEGGNWAYLLSAQPQFSDHCSWEKITAEPMVCLIAAQPQFASHCAWEKLGGNEWAYLLSVRPQFASHCAWEKLDGKAWSGLLNVQPQFADYCSWELLDGKDWSALLCAQPQFADHCAWGKLSGEDWCSLLCVRRQFADYCQWDRMDDKDWDELLQWQPQFAMWRKNKSAENHSDNV